MVVKEEALEEQSFSVDHHEPEALHIKEDPDKPLNVKKETDAIRFPLTVALIKSGDKDKPLFSVLHQHQTEDRDLPPSSSADQMKTKTDEEDFRGAESSENPDLNTHKDTQKEDAPKEKNPGGDQQDLELLQIKQEEEEPWTSLEGEQLNVKEETDPTKFPLTVVLVKSEDDDEKPLFSQLHQLQTKDGDLPPISSTDQMKAETDEEECGGAESSRNPDLNIVEDTSNSSETDVSDDDDDFDDVNHPDSQLKQLSDSGSETEDSEIDWKESRAAESGGHAVTKSLSCFECGQRFVNKRSLQRHMTCHSTARSSRRPVNKKRGKKNVRVLKKVQAGVKCFTCDDCGKTFHWKNHLSRHMRIHTGEKPFSCEVCGQRFNQNSNLNKHMRIHTGGKPFGCDVCGQRFNLKSYLHIHMRIHTGEKPFSCDVCGQRFNQKSNLNKHAKIHTGGKPFSCDFCGQRFNLKSYLNKHVRVHTGEKPFRCDVCEQRFNLKSHLNLHKIIHSGEKPFACDVCGQRLIQKSALKKHMKIHSEIKSFDCDVCGRRFNQKSALKRHLRIHTGDKPFGCDVCGQKFNQKAHLNKHMTIHTGAKPFGCDVCGLGFNLKSHLMRHTKIHTDGERV
ncbi:hypothetical protein CHARACLAT_011508 [Characodon lateralis]|uniref:C2H2-type domain-containing protein n=1 Tax=Characodon lateralis TaxID=208331 RepID=A0ABU7E0E2_9TELE|nr:hypothetical protein [Characodon lateralis]